MFGSIESCGKTGLAVMCRKSIRHGLLVAAAMAIHPVIYAARADERPEVVKVPGTEPAPSFSSAGTWHRRRHYVAAREFISRTAL